MILTRGTRSIVLYIVPSTLLSSGASYRHCRIRVEERLPVTRGLPSRSSPIDLCFFGSASALYCIFSRPRPVSAEFVLGRHQSPPEHRSLLRLTAVYAMFPRRSSAFKFPSGSAAPLPSIRAIEFPRAPCT
ncbi:hypothetical protein OH76DRAFT_18210 [Lentinus brumalis]|uniref:Uncharacterized protein n=1 Tax=Lentinus brumalis TaxID=2498619 RepID=A0A371DX61_9APHY|nr:hypothetical protein OH76DRAFT_18210 [Polyporus brumalis]